MESDNPGKSKDPEVLKAYFESLGLTEEEAAPLILNWTRTDPQSMTEVRQGILDERAAREALSERWVGDLKPTDK